MRTKNRLTITLPKDILSKIDSTIDGSIIRNRSHAIESLIRQSLKNPIETAVILTGGDKYSENTALKTIDGRMLVHIIISQLVKAGMKKIIVCTGKDGDFLKDAIGDGRQFGCEVSYVKESSPTGTGGAIKKAEKHIDEDNFLVIHGDVISNLNFESFTNFHIQEGTIATIVVMPKKGDKSFGKVLIEGNQIIEFFEKTESKGIDIINTGIYLFHKAIFQRLTSKECRMEKEVFPMLAKEKQLTAFLFQGYWQDISSPKEYKLASNAWGKISQ